MSMGYGDDENLRRLDAERIPTQQIVASAVIVRGPRLRISLDRRNRRIDFVGEPDGRGAAPFRIPPRSGCGFSDRVIGTQPRGSRRAAA
jgi:hypothetical protein